LFNSGDNTSTFDGISPPPLREFEFDLCLVKMVEMVEIFFVFLFMQHYGLINTLMLFRLSISDIGIGMLLVQCFDYYRKCFWVRHLIKCYPWLTLGVEDNIV
jgi:hypothetical protein